MAASILFASDLCRLRLRQLLRQIVAYRFSAPPFFMNCSQFRRRIEALVDEAGASP
jgi:MFS superfamily sulfate permease-like transporter